MRLARTPVLLLALLALAAQAEAAGGLFLRWNKCYGDGGLQSKAFACDTNAGNAFLTAGFELGVDLGQVSGNEIVLELAATGSSWPAWWAFRNPGTCRMTSMSINSVFDATSTVCVDWEQANAVAGVTAYDIGVRGANTARLVAALAMPLDLLQDLSAGQEYFAFNIFISRSKTVGAGACGGCATPVCLLLASINVTTPVLANSQKLSGPGNTVDSDFVTWQGGAGVVVGGAIGCPAATPVQQRTWGTVKALYH